MDERVAVLDLIAQADEHQAARRWCEAAQTWRGAAVAAFADGDRASARTYATRARDLAPEDPAGHRVLATIDEVEGALPAAFAGYAAACRLDPAQPQATIALARVALALGRTADAVRVAEAATARGIDDAGLLRTLGIARALQRDYRGATTAFAAALRSEPHPDTFVHLAAAQLECNDIAAACTALDAALATDPDHSLATFHRGIASYAQGEFAAAIAAFERAIALGCEEAHLNLARVHLLLGDYERGMAHFGQDTATRRALPVFSALPMWDGTPAPAKRILIWHEQGAGDSIQLARFLRPVRDLTAAVTFAGLRELADIIGSVDGVDDVVDMHRPLRWDDFDCWLPTTRLPVIFRANLATIPTQPYVHVDPVRRKRLQPLLDAVGGLRVGLVWSGNPLYARDAVRSCGLAALEPLAAVRGASFFALQQGAARHDRPHGALRLIPVNAAVHDYADTAALIAGLDLVITVDTSVAHLAGALGRPAWVMLPRTCDWRWLLAGDIAPWYPTLRLFRQTGDGWGDVVAAMVTELERAARPNATD